MLPLLLSLARAADGDVLFHEDWTSGAGRWLAQGDPVALIQATDAEGVLRTWQHETLPASGGRVFLLTPISVRGGASYCLSARVHATTGAGAFLGFDLSDAAGARSTEHWMIGVAGNGDGYGGLVVPVQEDSWSRYAADFTLEAHATHIVLKDELWVGAAAGAADFTDIQLAEGPCDATPVDTDDGGAPPDDPGPQPSDSSYPVQAGTEPGYGPERGAGAGGCGGHQGAKAALLLLLWPRRRAALTLAVATACGGTWSDESGLKGLGVQGPPPLLVEPERPMSGGDVRVALDLPADAAWTLTTSGAGCGAVTGGSGVGPSDQTAPAAADGTCLVRAEVRPAGAEPWVLARRFSIQASDPDLPPVEVVGGVWRDVLPGRAGLPEAPVVTALNGPTTFINGASLDFGVTLDVDGPLAALVVTFEGWEGGYVVPIDDEGAALNRSLWDDTPLVVRVPAHYFDETSNTLLSMGISGLDRQDRLGAAQTAVLNGQEVGTGDVQIGLSWGSATDVDLHVLEPSGEEISYASTQSSSGGQLDLDSNAGCSIDGINHENVFWPTGSSPEGEYTVSAQLYSGCEVGSATGSVTMTFCGETSPIVAPFTLSEGSPYASWTFSSACGEGKRVSGRVRYEDRAATSAGYAPGAFVPAQHVTVRLVRESDSGVLATGVTDASGRYDLPFSNDSAPGFRVEVQARADDETLRVQVTTLDEELYVWQTEEVFDDASKGVFEAVDIDIPQSGNGDVLSLFDVARRGIDVAWVGASRRPSKMLTLSYTRGQRPNRSNSSEYRPFWHEIRVAGDPADPDVYDDWTIAHEVGHFIMHTLGASDTTGGDHDLTERVAPTLAWDEGWATWFASQVMEGSTYIDLTQTSASTVYDFDTLPPIIPLGNEDDKLGGHVGEAVISATLLDLSDSLDEPLDNVNGRDPSIWWVFRHRLREPKTDRGASGRDLVDFLDAWVCANLGDLGASDREGLRGIAVGLQRLSYDFAPDCP